MNIQKIEEFDDNQVIVFIEEYPYAQPVIRKGLSEEQLNAELLKWAEKQDHVDDLNKRGIVEFKERDTNVYMLNEDDRKLYFGSGNDVSIYYDGIHLHIDTSSLEKGTVVIDDLPTTDPQVKNGLWNDNGTLKVSLGK